MNEEEKTNQGEENISLLIEKNLAEILHSLNLVFNRVIVKEESTDHFRANISSAEEMNLIIGKNGDNMSSMQHILKLLVQKKLGRRISVIVDADNYKKRREEGIINTARERATRCLSTGRNQKMPPMSAYLRRLVHIFIRGEEEFKNLDTRSVGDGDIKSVEFFIKGESVVGDAPENKKAKDKSNAGGSGKEDFSDIEKIDELMDF